MALELCFCKYFLWLKTLIFDLPNLIKRVLNVFYITLAQIELYSASEKVYDATFDNFLAEEYLLFKFIAGSFR